MKKRILANLAVFMMAILLVACGSQPESRAEKPAPAKVDPTETPFSPTNTPAPATERPTNTPLPEMVLEELHGEWGHILFSLELHSDGTYLLVWPAEPGFENPEEFGTYQVEYNVIAFQPERYEATESPTIDGCHEGEAYAYTASFSDGDTRFLKLVENGTDPCGWRAGHWNAEPVWQLMEKYSSNVPAVVSLSMDEFIGRWDTAVAILMFNEDGTWGAYESSAALESGDSYDGGTYLLKDNTLTLVSDADSRECPDSTGTYKVTPGDGNLTVDLVSDTCSGRGSTLSDPDVKVWQRGG